MALFGKKKDSSAELPPLGGTSPFDQVQNPNQNYYQQPPPPSPQGYPEQPQQPQAFPQQSFQQDFAEPEPDFSGDSSSERIEEVAEAIIDEKWKELVKDINVVIEWKERTETNIQRIMQEIVHIKERFESLHKGVLGKISEYDQNLNTVGSEIKAMEMAFQKILPTFTENVNKLERYTKRIK